MAPETSTLNIAVQVRITEDPTVLVGLEGERDADVIKSLGTEGKTNAEVIITVDIKKNNP